MFGSNCTESISIVTYEWGHTQHRVNKHMWIQSRTRDTPTIFHGYYRKLSMLHAIAHDQTC